MGQLGAQRTQVSSWALFDFANSVLVVNGGLYFSQWLVLDNGVNESWYNLAISLTSLCLLITGPAFGVLGDQKSISMGVLRLTALTMFILTVGISLVGQEVTNLSVRVTISLLFFVGINYSYQLSLLFYNALLGHVAPRTHYGRVSGIGLASGWIGAVVGLAVIVPFVQGRIPPFQPAGRIQAFLPAALLFGILVVVSLSRLREPPRHNPRRDLAQTHWRQLWADLRRLWASRSLLCFFLVYILVSDAILTVQNNMPLYLEIVMGFTDRAKALLIMMFLTMSAIGAWSAGHLADRVGLKRVFSWIIVAWALFLILMAFSWQRAAFVGVFGVLGALFGAFWATARALLTTLVPEDRRNTYFGLYVGFDRLASLIGPLIWIVPVTVVADLGPDRYRLAVCVMAALILASIPLLRGVRADGLGERNRDAGGIA